MAQVLGEATACVLCFESTRPRTAMYITYLPLRHATVLVRLFHKDISSRFLAVSSGHHVVRNSVYDVRCAIFREHACCGFCWYSRGFGFG